MLTLTEHVCNMLRPSKFVVKNNTKVFKVIDNVNRRVTDVKKLMVSFNFTKIKNDFFSFGTFSVRLCTLDQ